MVDIKREDLTLQDWTRGISADEFAWGSYYYSEWISSGYATKWFELWYRLGKIKINDRANWYAVGLSPSIWLWFVAFTKDWRIEMQELYNWASTWTWDIDWWWAYYAYYQWWFLNNWYLNGLTYWDYLIGVRQDSVDFINKDAFSSSAEVLWETDMSVATWWTIGTWWTITDNWAEHTTGNTWTLEYDISAEWYTTSDYLRCAVKITNRTTGTLKVSVWNWDEPFNSHTAWWYVGTLRGKSTTTTLTLTPSSNFDWTIEYVNLHLYDNPIQTVSIYWGTLSDRHPALCREWELYIGCKNFVNIINLDDKWQTYKELIDENFEIVAMNQQAWNIIIRATDWFDSRQYYWNWVDAVATEVIEWKWLIIQSATWTETISYVLTTSWAISGSVDGYEYRLYAVSGYQRNLIATKLYQFWSDYYLDAEHYNSNKRFDFNDVQDDHWMTIFLDSLFIPGCDWVYKYGYDIPWVASAWTRPVKYDVWAKHISLWQSGHYFGVAFRSWSSNYIWAVDNRLYTSKWFIVSESIYWDKLSTRKAIEKIKIWYKNVASTVGNIKVYAIVDDTYFWRFRPTVTPTTRPSVWDVYSVAYNTTAKVIDVDTTNWVITFVTVSDTWSRLNLANTSLTKVSWAWDDTITVGYNYDNMVLIKTIESDNQWYGSDLIFGKNFVESYIPYWHKLQLVVELNSNDNRLSPEVYEISMTSDITDVIL